jgi:Glycosyltransferase family 87
MTDLLVAPATLRKWLLLGAALGLIAYCYHYWPVGGGAKLYVGAAQCLWDGLPLQQCDKYFTYPPAVAFAMLPLLAAPTALINPIWYAVTLGTLTGCFMLSVALIKRAMPVSWSDRDLAWLYLIAVVLSLKFLFAAIGNQSYDAVVVVLILGGLYALSEQRPVWSGIAFGIAAALKATPLLFLPYLLFTRRFAAAAVMLAALIVVSLLPDLVFTHSFSGGYFAAWLRNVGGPALSENLEGLPHIFWSAGSATNYSLRGLIGTFMDDGDSLFRIVIYAVYAGYALIVAAIVLRSYRRPWAIATDGALLLLSMLLMSPMTSLTHFSALILYFVLLAAVWVKDDYGLRTVALVFMTVFFVASNLTSDDLAGKAVSNWAHRYRIMNLGMLSLVIFSAIYAERRVRRDTTLAPAPKAAAEPQVG